LHSSNCCSIYFLYKQFNDLSGEVDLWVVVVSETVLSVFIPCDMTDKWHRQCVWKSIKHVAIADWF